MIKRNLYDVINKRLADKKAIILLGARQTGKTTLLKEIVKNKPNVLWLNADEADVQSIFETASSTRFRSLLRNYNIVILDEAQRIPDIGLKLKLITDQIKDVKIIATGSSAFELANKINEPLTGRKWEFNLYPLSFSEMVAHSDLLEEKRMLHHRLVYGYYPDVVLSSGNEKEVLKSLTDSYLYKDILMWERINKPDKLLKLLKALALQLGNEVSYNELGKLVGMDNQTVEKYILLLEQTFIIFRLCSLRRNLRKELSRSRKIYFYDNGIRNSLIASFADVGIRTDTAALWENFLISERQKVIEYNSLWANRYFWRTQDQQELDYIEDFDGILHAFEFKWNPSARVRLSKTFSRAYPEHTFNVITPENFESFLL
jgi:predicted AAA+ superfamily ATPase